MIPDDPTVDLLQLQHLCLLQQQLLMSELRQLPPALRHLAILRSWCSWGEAMGSWQRFMLHLLHHIFLIYGDYKSEPRSRTSCHNLGDAP